MAEEAINSIRTVFAFCQQELEGHKYEKHIKTASEASLARNRYLSFTMGSVYFIIYCTYGLGFWFGSTQVVKGVISPGDVVTAYFATMSAGQAIGTMSQFVGKVAQAKGTAAKLFDIIDLKSEIDASKKDGAKLTSLRGDVEFHDVHFVYPTRPQEPVLRGITLKVPEGSKVALVGHSGCGKSTIVSLIERFYLPSAGSITIGGTPIESINLKCLRDRIGLVNQEPTLFSMSIKDNILLGNPDASFDDVVKAAKKANAYDFINALPNKFDTEVGEGGGYLSGGQKQRIAIARAIIRDPEILLLDEATSALDTNSEVVVQEALDNVSMNVTTIIVAHRLATVKKADLIVVLREGEVVEMGTHESLYREDGVYAGMVNSQIQKEELSHSKKAGRGCVVGDKDKPAMVKDDTAIQMDPEELSQTKDEKVSKPSAASLIKRLFAYNRPEAFFLTAGSILAFIDGANFILFAFIFSEVINVLSKPVHQIPDQAQFWALMFLALACGMFILTVLKLLLLSFAGVKLATRIRTLVFQHIMKMDISWFDKPENATGALTTRLTADGALIEDALGDKMAIVIAAFGSLLCSCLMAFLAAPILALIVIGAVPVIMLAPILQAQLMMSHLEASHKAYAEAGGLVGEGLSAIKTVTALGCQQSLMNAYAQKMKVIRKCAERKAHICGSTMGVGQAMVTLAFGLGFWQGAIRIANGDLNFIDVLRVVTAVTFTKHIAQNASLFASNYGKAKIAVTEIFAILDQSYSIREGQKDPRCHDWRCTGLIQFQNVHFRYPQRQEQKVLNGVSFSVSPGEKVALVGSSGCGKSTIISLLERFYDPEEGRILVDGIDLKSLSIRQFRDQCGHVGQEPVLFAGSIMDNILYGKGTAVFSEVEQATRKAHAEHFISELKDKYETMVGTKGAQLSGGQKQRIAIARAIIRTPTVLLLDEATSALDTKSEKIVQQALDEVSRDRTTLIIAHRLSTIRNADRIIVLDHGRVVESGSHTELLSHPSSLYAKLIEAQLGN